MGVLKVSDLGATQLKNIAEPVRVYSLQVGLPAQAKPAAQLIDATTGGHLWAERFDRDLTDIFAVQDDVTAKIVSALAVSLSAGDRQSIAAEHTDNLEADDCFLRGRELFRRYAREANREARSLLRRAIELDLRFAPAYAYLASALVNDYASGWSASPAQTVEEAEKTARQAAQLDDRNPYALLALAMACLWARRYDEALSAAEKVIAFNPNFAEGHTARGFVLHYVGRSERLSNASNVWWRSTPISPACGCITRPWRNTSWAVIPRLSAC